MRPGRSWRTTNAMACARWRGGGFSTVRKAPACDGVARDTKSAGLERHRSGNFDRPRAWIRCARLLAGLRGGAVDPRVNTRIVEGAREDGYCGRAGPSATADGLVVIAALPGSDGTDDQPYDQKRRSDMHLDLHDIIFSKAKRRSAAISDLVFDPMTGFHSGSLTSTSLLGIFPCLTAPPRYLKI